MKDPKYRVESHYLHGLSHCSRNQNVFTAFMKSMCILGIYVQAIISKKKCACVILLSSSYNVFQIYMYRQATKFHIFGCIAKKKKINVKCDANDMK